MAITKRRLIICAPMRADKRSGAWWIAAYVDPSGAIRAPEGFISDGEPLQIAVRRIARAHGWIVRDAHRVGEARSYVIALAIPTAHNPRQEVARCLRARHAPLAQTARGLPRRCGTGAGLVPQQSADPRASARG
ncbi:MAG: hypothetical protein KatS3mg087_1347 [Patescibacteria group bacterium]|nr:MAG: hypothetical protein KatS3mg087_1347 [Patescibacteria group bacterium]